MTTPTNLAAAHEESPGERRAHIHAILQTMDDVMFMTRSSNGAPALRARPLRVTRLDDDDTFWFMVGTESNKVLEVERDAHANVTGQDSARWIHLSGRASIVTDRETVRSMWNKMHQVWFPEGPESPGVCLLRFRPESAEYWDNSGIAGVKFLYEAARALLTGTEPRAVKGLHGEAALKP